MSGVHHYNKTIRKPEDRLKSLKDKLEKAERALKKIQYMIRQKRKQMENDGHKTSERLDIMLHEERKSKDEVMSLRENVTAYQKRFRGGRNK